VVDLGCGGGLWRKLFQDFTYLGLDQSPGMIKSAKGRGVAENESFIHMPRWDKIPLEDGTVDLVWTSAVLQHNKHPHKAKMVEEIVRVLRPGGIYLCTENTFRKDNYMTTFPSLPFWHRELDDGYSFTKFGWKRFMAGHGLKLERFTEPSEYLYRKDL
jgi:SAM-dependent methyltransferase